MNWTSKDERRHAELQAELEELRAKRMQARDRLQAVLHLCYQADYETVSVDLLIRHADAMRDALAPFDSGCRVMEQE